MEALLPSATEFTWG